MPVPTSEVELGNGYPVPEAIMTRAWVMLHGVIFCVQIGMNSEPKTSEQGSKTESSTR